MFYDAYEKPDLEDVEHYGVLGMKWGVRKNPVATYSKATKKLRKLDKKVLKARRKADKVKRKAKKLHRKADKAALKVTNMSNWKKQMKKQIKAGKMDRKFDKKELKADKKFDKALDWTKKMNDVFKDYNLSDFDPNDVELAKAYTQIIFENKRRGR